MLWNAGLQMYWLGITETEFQKIVIGRYTWNTVLTATTLLKGMKASSTRGSNASDKNDQKKSCTCSTRVGL